ncbi:MAG TPA: DEAD/DEAH box helicase, partial [Rectinemataceae bacterium]
MDLSRFSIDPALAAAAQTGDSYRSVFFERMLEPLFEKGENLFVKLELEKAREEIILLPAFHWLSTSMGPEGRRRVLCLCASPERADALHTAATALASALPNMEAPALLGSDSGVSAPLVIADFQAFAASAENPALGPRGFGFIIVDEAELLAELPGEAWRKATGKLLPSWERKTLVTASRHTPKAKNLAWDIADNPREIKLGESMGFAGTMAAVSTDIKEADKIRYILRLLATRPDSHICVFCNLKTTAAELSLRLGMNGVASDYIAGNLNPERKKQIVSKALGWTGPMATADSIADPIADSIADPEAALPAAPHAANQAAESRFPRESFVLVLTDEGAKGISSPGFSTLVNYDIPLEPEYYFERLNFLNREAEGAALYNLVCERYMFGLPAIERLIDTSLAVVPLLDPESLPADLSAGKRVEMPEPRRRDRFSRNRRDDRGRSLGHDRRDSGEGHSRPDRPERRERESGHEARHELRRESRPEPHLERRQAPIDPYALS